MRKIVLHERDAHLFDEEMLPDNLDYFMRHKDTFRRMWLEQGKSFWSRFVLVFKSYIVRYSLLGELPCDSSQLDSVLNFAFVYINQNFVEGKANQAKNLILNIAALGQNKHRNVFLDSKSLIKDPFYNKETRDLFREFFGPANEKASYVKVFLLSPVYMRFGGSVCRCLELWKDAQEVDPADDSYWISPIPLDVEETNEPVLLCPVHLEDCNMKYYQEYIVGDHEGPLFLPEEWNLGNPRRDDPQNPLYDTMAALMPDWRYGLTCKKFQEFVAYCYSKYVPPDEQCPECRTITKRWRKKLKKKKKKKQLQLTAAHHDPSEPCGCANAVSISAANMEETLNQAIPDAIKSQIKKIAKISGAANTCNCSCHHTALKEKGLAGAYTEVGAGVLGRPEAEGMNELPVQEKQEKKKRVCFTANSVSFKRKQDILVPSDNESFNLSVIFDIVQRQDPTTSCKEISLTISSVEPVTDSDLSKGDGSSLLMQKMDSSAALEMFSSEKLVPLLANLPQQCAWAEGLKWCAVSIDYSSVENSGEAATSFIAKISNIHIDFAKALMESLLQYIVQRKRRDSIGWMLQEDDIFSVCLSFKQHVQKFVGAVFSVYAGLDLLDALTAMEERTLQIGPSEVTMDCFEGRTNFSSTEEVNLKLSELLVAPKTRDFSGNANNKQYSHVSSQTQDYIAQPETTLPAPCSIVRPKIKTNRHKKKDGHSPMISQASKIALKSHEAVRTAGGVPGAQRMAMPPNFPPNFPQSSNEDTIFWTSGKSAFIMGNDKDMAEIIDYMRAAGNRIMPQASPWASGLTISSGSAGGKESGSSLLTGLGGAAAVFGTPPGGALSSVKPNPTAVKTLSDSKSSTSASKKRSKATAKQSKTQKGKVIASQGEANEMSSSGSTEAGLQDSDSKTSFLHQAEGVVNPSDTKRAVAVNPGDTKQAVENGNSELESNSIGDTVMLAPGQDHFFQTGDVSSNPNSITGTKKPNRDGGSKTLRTCANCQKEEPKPKTYSKCQRCKDERVLEPRFYCGRECQISDWVARHRDEHKRGNV